MKAYLDPLRARTIGLLALPPLTLLAAALQLVACSSSSSSTEATSPSTATKPDGVYIKDRTGEPWLTFHSDSGVVEFTFSRGQTPDGTFTVDDKGWMTIKTSHGDPFQGRLYVKDLENLKASLDPSDSPVYTKSSVYKKPASPPQQPEWDLAKAQAAFNADAGTKNSYTCHGYSAHTMLPGDEGHLLVAEIPEAGIHRLSNREISIQATNEQAAAKIMYAAFTNIELGTIRCLRTVPVGQVATAEVSRDQYEPITSPIQLWGLYYANSSEPVDYERVLKSIDQSRGFSYAHENDGFKKHDMLVAFTKELDTAIAHARQHPYIKMPPSAFTFPKYDFSISGYPLAHMVTPDDRYSLQDAGAGAVSVRLAVPKNDFEVYHPATEADARSIESALSKEFRNVHVVNFGKVVQVDPGSGGEAAPFITIALTRTEIRTGLGSAHASTDPIIAINAK